MGRKSGKGRGLPAGGKSWSVSPLECEAERGSSWPPEWWETRGGGCQVLGWGVELLRGTDTPGVKELTRGDKTSGVTLKGDGVPEADTRGRGGDGNSPAIQDTGGSSNISRGEEMVSGQEPAPPPSPQWGTEEEERGEVIPQSHSKGAGGSRPEHGALARREYGLLVPEELAGDPDAAGAQGSGDNPKDTIGAGGTDRRETGTG